MYTMHLYMYYISYVFVLSGEETDPKCYSCRNRVEKER